MEPEDFSSQLDCLQTLDEVSEYLDQDQSSALTGTATPSLQNNSNRNGGNEQTGEEDDADKFKVNLEYKLYVCKPKPTTCNTRNANRRKANAVGPKDNLFAFKRSALAVLRAKEPSVVARHAQEQEQEGELSWYAIIQNGEQFLEINKTDLDNSEIFAEFLEMADCKGGLKSTLSRMILNSSRRWRNEALRHLAKRNREGNEASTEPQPTAGAKKNSDILNNIWTIRATHMPFERLTGSMELPVMIDPKDPARFIALSPDRIALWARAMAQNPEITKHKPPSSLAFKFQTKAEFNGSSSRESENRECESSPVNQHQSSPINWTREANLDSPASCRARRNARTPPNISPMAAAYAGMGGHIAPPMAWQNSPWAWPAALPIPFNAYPGMPNFGMNSLVPPVPQPDFAQENPAPVSSPPPSDVTVDITDYLTFCHVDVNCKQVQNALLEYGITHYA
ncbi:hypothetical protein PTTG_25909 [Puccinia triticina 1-1 BBBD Race 1]|uniref:Uncharacterized protein n=1 Tax=Puccinia triticina (isolate 1-1 / race 1 (BBBD)) TaxID=630390 RepID=A0A180GYQ4_PUCT1|nr:hypothetical protein PTTG_25909 [Puccinia triticina 1-1 BBBD Race 1]